jgi:hypothetical protein
LWNLIDLFSQTDFFKVSQSSSNNKIDAKTIAQYLASHLDRPASLDNIMKVALRFDSIPDASNEYVTRLLQSLREFQSSNNNALPFTDSQVKKLYLRLSQLKLGGATSELILYLLKSKGMNAEIFDFCCNQDESAPAELIAYYKAESLMGMRLKRGTTYGQAVGE